LAKDWIQGQAQAQVALAQVALAQVALAQVALAQAQWVLLAQVLLVEVLLVEVSLVEVSLVNHNSQYSWSRRHHRSLIHSPRSNYSRCMSSHRNQDMCRVVAPHGVTLAQRCWAQR
jgi:hypothetical protein